MSATASSLLFPIAGLLAACAASPPDEPRPAPSPDTCTCRPVNDAVTDFGPDDVICAFGTYEKRAVDEADHQYEGFATNLQNGERCVEVLRDDDHVEHRVYGLLTETHSRIATGEFTAEQAWLGMTSILEVALQRYEALLVEGEEVLEDMKEQPPVVVKLEGDRLGGLKPKLEEERRRQEEEIGQARAELSSLLDQSRQRVASGWELLDTVKESGPNPVVLMAVPSAFEDIFEPEIVPFIPVADTAAANRAPEPFRRE